MTVIIETRHAARETLEWEEAAGLPRRCEACGVLCRDVHRASYYVGGRGYELHTCCNDPALCDARIEARAQDERDMHAQVAGELVRLAREQAVR